MTGVAYMVEKIVRGKRGRDMRETWRSAAYRDCWFNSGTIAHMQGCGVDEAIVGSSVVKAAG